MMTDRELLEKAAMAAGIFLTRETMASVLPKYQWDDTDEPVFDGDDMRGVVLWYGEDGEIGGTEALCWNPLADDGDALRLAVALRISLSMLPQIVDATAGDVMCHEPWYDDPHAATRRAIVRAAAAMADAKEQA